ncbi:MAG: glycine C-acetyltransferase [Alphaproteobacteria bacterium]|jgi:glycine C-acetyltransferase
MHHFNEQISNDIKNLKEAGTYKQAKHLLGPMSSHAHMVESSDPITILSSNNYLGLANHVDVVKAGHEALDKYGLGTASVRFICGTMTIHEELEAKIAAFHSTEAALTYSSCWAANTGLFAVICKAGDVLVSDALNHASIIDGCRLVNKQVTKAVYAHSDMSDLEKTLQKHKDANNIFVVTDGVFSMEGDLAKLPEITALCERYNAVLIVDDSHGVGVMGQNGKGTAEHFGVENKVDIYTGTLGKALGGAAGGYVAGKKDVIDILFQASRPQIFSNGISPVTAAGAMKAIELVTQKRLTSLHEKIKYFREGLQKIGLMPVEGDSAILAIILGETAFAIKVSDTLLKYGFFVTGFGFPVVPEGEARIRIQVSDGLSYADIDAAIVALQKTSIDLNFPKF